MSGWIEQVGMVVKFATLTVPTNQMRMLQTAPVQPLGSEISCALNRRSENVVVESIIVPQLELRNVKMQVFLDDLRYDYVRKGLIASL